MSTMSTFGAYTTARLGIYSSTKWLDVIGNNISNINTEGYTRQSVDQISLYMRGSDKYQTGYDHRVGNGGLVQRVTQMRDPYIDIRYRNEISSVGAMDAKLGGLQQVSSILDEVAYGEDEDANLGVMELQFNDLISQMQRLVDEGAGEETFDTNVRTSAASLCALFNSYADRLEELRQNQETGLVQDIQTVNDILTGIRDLSEAIRKANLYGGDALEQKDQRNLLIDQLAEYIRIDVKYELEEIVPGQKVEKLVISLNGNDQGDNTTNKTVLVDGVYCAQLSIDHPVQKSEQIRDPDTKELKYNADGSPVMRMYYYDADGVTVISSVTEQVRQADGTIKPVTKWYGADKTTEIPFPGANLRKVYVDDEGNETANINQARRKFNDYYQVEVGALRDRWNCMQPTDDVTVIDKLETAAPAAVITDPAIANARWKELKRADMAREPQQYPDTVTTANGTVIKYNYEIVPITDKRDPTRVLGFRVDQVEVNRTTLLTDNTLYGAIQAERELLTEQGEYATAEQIAMDRNANIKRGIPYYQKALDTLANFFAATINQANQYSREIKAEDLETAFGVPADFSKADVYVNDVIELPNGTKQQFATVMVDGECYVMADNCNVLVSSPAKAYKVLNALNAGEISGDKQLVEKIRVEYGDISLTDKEAIELFKDDIKLLKVTPPGTLTDLQKTHLLPTEAGGAFDQGVWVEPGEARAAVVNVLFSNHGSRDDPTKITAANISVSKSWGEGSIRIIQSRDPDHPSTDNSNLYHILNLLQVEHHEYRPLASDLKDTAAYADQRDLPETRAVTFRGSFQRMFTDNICGKLATDVKSTNTMLNNYATAADELYVDRDAVMGVDLNDETMNMMQVQKSLTAAYRLMTVIDDMLDRLINNTAV